MIERAVILAVGSITHRSQLTYNRVHAMLPALGKPLVVRIMNRLHRANIQKFTVVVGVSEGEVASYLNTNWVPDARVDFILKSGNDSLFKILTDIAQRDQQPFLITSYNCFTHSQFPTSLLKTYSEFPNSLVVGGAASTLSKAPRHYYASVEKQRITEIHAEKPANAASLILADVAVCGSDFVRFLQEHPANAEDFKFQLMDIFSDYVRAGGAAHTAQTAWTLQIEDDLDLLTLNRMLLDEGQDAHILSELSPSIQIIPPVRIDPQVSIGQGATIGPHVYLERGCNIGQESYIHNAIITNQAKVAARETVENSIVSSRGRISE